MNAYLIDPTDETIETVHYDGDWKTISYWIAAPTFDAAFTSDGLTVYIDDEGLFKSDQSFFTMAGFPHPLAGRALVLGKPDEDGDTTECLLNPSQIKARVKFVDLIKIHDRIVAVEK